MRCLLIVIALAALPVIAAACGDDDSSNSTQQTVNAAINNGKTAVNNGKTAVNNAQSTVNGARTAVDNGDATVQGKATASATGGLSLATKVQITEKDFSISADNSSPPHGTISFDIKNDGATQHQFVVLKTDIPEGQLPMSNGTVNETASGITKIAELVAIDPGQSKTLSTNALASGTYVLICNNPAHYQAGMHTTLHVQ